MITLSDGSTWPTLKELSELEWSLRYASDSADPYRLEAARSIWAFMYLVRAPRKKRELVVRELRAEYERGLVSSEPESHE